MPCTDNMTKEIHLPHDMSAENELRALRGMLAERLRKYPHIQSVVVNEALYKMLNPEMVNEPKIQGQVVGLPGKMVLIDVICGKVPDYTPFYFSPYDRNALAQIMVRSRDGEIVTVVAHGFEAMITMLEQKRGIMKINGSVNVLFERLEMIYKLLEESLQEFAYQRRKDTPAIYLTAEGQRKNDALIQTDDIVSIFNSKLQQLRIARLAMLPETEHVPTL